MTRRSMNGQGECGISLLEMAIVVVIVGILAGTVLAGQSLIAAASLRNFATQSEQFRAAANQFKLQYRYLPGDLNNATRYWGWQGIGGCANSTGAPLNAANGVCDGTADDRMDSAGGAGSPTEIFQFWRELSLAGFIDGKYTGASLGSRFDATVGDALDKRLATEGIIGAANVPATPLPSRTRVTTNPNVRGSRSGWSVLSTDFYILGDSSVTGANAFREPYRRYFYTHFRVGLKNLANLYVLEFLTPAEMRDIDKKIDDGKPLTGIMVPRFIYGATALDPACTNAPFTTNDGPSGTDGIGNRAYNAGYNVTYNNIACGVLLEMKP